MQKQHRTKYLLKNTFLLALGDFGTKFISFFLVPLYTNLLTAQQYGTTDFINALSTLLLPFLSFNIVESILRFSIDKNADHNKIMSISLVILAFASLAGLAVIPLAQALPPIQDYSLPTYWYVLSVVFYQVIACSLRGKEALIAYCFTNILHALTIGCLNLLFLLVLHKGVGGYLLAFTLANFLCAGFGILIGKLYRHFRHFQLDLGLARNMLRFSVALIPTSLLWWISDAADHVMVTAIAGAAANGIYAVSYKVPSILASVAGIFNRAWIYSSVQEADSQDVAAYTNQVFRQFACVVTLAAAAFLLIVKPFLLYYVGPEFYIAWKSTPFLILSYVFSALSTFLVTQYLTKKDSRGLLVSAAIGAFSNILLNIPFIFLWGAPGAALGTAVSYVLQFVYAVWDTRKYVPLHIGNRNTLTAFSLLILMCATVFWESPWGQGLLLLEFLLVLVNSRHFLSHSFQVLRKKLHKG